MSKALVLGAAALALSAGTASAQGYGYGYGYDNSYAAPVADLAAPDYGYGYGYAAPAYAAPATAGTNVIHYRDARFGAGLHSAAGSVRLLRGGRGLAADL